MTSDKPTEPQLRAEGKIRDEGMSVTVASSTYNFSSKTSHAYSVQPAEKLNLSDYIAVVSDFDDTILDNTPDGSQVGLHERSMIEAVHNIMKASGRLAALAALPEGAYSLAIRRAPEHSVEGALWWLLTETSLIADNVFDRRHPLIQELVIAKSVSYRRLLRTEAKEVPGAQEFFHRLHANGFADKLAIASTGHRADILAFLQAHGFANYFTPQHIIAKEDTRYLKPHPESFEKAIQSMGITAKGRLNILAFEDEPLGIRAAKAQGLFTCALTTRFSAKFLMNCSTPPDFIAQDFNEYIRAFSL